jgi:hypothetical protein
MNQGASVHSVPPAKAEGTRGHRTMRVGSPQHFRWLHGIVKTVLVMNLLDAIFTLLWVRAGLAKEANTLLDELVEGHALAFIFVKLSLVSLGSLLLWSQRERPVAVIGVFLAFIAYYYILLFHLSYASTLIRSL